MKNTAPGVKASESKRSATTGTRSVMVRNLPDASYQILRRISFESQRPYAEILAYLLDNADEDDTSHGVLFGADAVAMMHDDS